MRQTIASALALSLIFASPALARITVHAPLKAPRPSPLPGTHSPAPAPRVSPQALLPATHVPFREITLFGSGVGMYALQDGRLPRVWYDLRLDAGERYVPRRFSGLSSLAAAILQRGPADMRYEAYRQQLFRQGVEIDWEASNHFMIAHVKCRPNQLFAVTQLVRRTAEHPHLDDATFALIKDRVINQRRAQDDDMSYVTFTYAKQMLWDFRPEARLPDGWVPSLKAIRRADLQGYFQARLAHPPAFVTAVGPLTPEKLAISLAPGLSGWVGAYTPSRAAFPVDVGGRQAILIDKPGATNNQIYFLSPEPLELDSAQGAAAEVFFTAMGGGLSGRLGKSLRVERGLTYTAIAGLRRGEWPSWYVYTFGGATQSPKLIAGIREIFDAGATGLSRQETVQAKDLLLKSYANEMETPAEQMSAVADAVGQGLPANYPFVRPRLIARVTAADTVAVGRGAAGLRHATLVMMGDAAKMRRPLQAVLPVGETIEIKSLEELASEATTNGVRVIQTPRP